MFELELSTRLLKKLILHLPPSHLLRKVSSRLEKFFESYAIYYVQLCRSFTKWLKVKPWILRAHVFRESLR